MLEFYWILVFLGSQMRVEVVFWACAWLIVGFVRWLCCLGCFDARLICRLLKFLKISGLIWCSSSRFLFNLVFLAEIMNLLLSVSSGRNSGLFENCVVFWDYWKWTEWKCWWIIFQVCFWNMFFLFLYKNLSINGQFLKNVVKDHFHFHYFCWVWWVGFLFSLLPYFMII